MPKPLKRQLWTVSRRPPRQGVSLLLYSHYQLPLQTPPSWGHEQLAQLGTPHLALLKNEFFLIKLLWRTAALPSLGLGPTGLPSL